MDCNKYNIDGNSENADVQLVITKDIKSDPDDDLKLVCTPDINIDCEDASAPIKETVSTKQINDMLPRLIGFGLSATTKRKHHVLSLEDKIELLKKLENGETVASLATLYNVGRATIFDIKNKKDSILSYASKLTSDDELKTRKTLRKVKGKSKGRASKESNSETASSNTMMGHNEFPNMSKRKHNVLSIETKIEIIQRLERGETGSSLAPIYNVGRATISDIKNKKDSILMFASKLKSEDGLKKRKTMRKANDTSLEDAVYMWYVQKLSQGEVVTGPLLCEKALELNSKLGGPPDFKASTGWLKNFRSRHGIKQIHSEKETFTGDTSAATSFLQSYLDLLQQEGFSRDDIYSADETEIDWQSMPKNSAVSASHSEELNRNPERVTVLVCANTSWSHSLPLLVIGKTKKSKCFKKVACLPVIYRSQRNGWMDSEIFMEWYANEFIPTVKKERELVGKCGKVLLLLDSAPFHPVVDMLNVVDENFKVTFLPSNVTELVHPMDQSIVNKLKRNFKKNILRRLLLAPENEEGVVEYSNKLTLKECCYIMADAWNSLSEENMKQSWKNSWEVPLESEIIHSQQEKSDVQEFMELFQVIPGFSKCSIVDAHEWLQNDATDPGHQILNEDEIVTSVKNDEFENEYDVDEGSTNDNQDFQLRPSHAEAFMAFEKTMEWCERQKECSPDELIFLKRLRDMAAKKCWILCEESKHDK